MSYRPKGKRVSTDINAPEALAICDFSGFVFHNKDLVKQMEWRGNGLIWTGFMVGKPYLDQPNEQLRPPILPPDPVPVRIPRLQQPEQIIWNLISSPNWNQLNIDQVQWPNWSGYDDGYAALSPAQRSQALYSFNWGWA